MKLLLLFLCFQIAAAPRSKAAERFPAPGISIPEATRAALEEKLLLLQSELSAATNETPDKTRLLPDARIYEKAVRTALHYNEFYRASEFAIADKLLDEGLARARALKNSSAQWTTATGLVVRAYQSRIDGSIQPYGLVVPPAYHRADGKRYRLDIWLHGRDEKLTELKFMHERSTRAGEFTPPDTFVLHPYGRYCNAFKFAGETDVLEALAAVQEAYPIDPGRIVLRGFSMGGAGAWHLATHFADRWICAAPGAGFAESPQYLRLDESKVPPYERLLWQWYNATDYALNLFHCPTVAYSGELDKQRQAADVMAAALAREGLPLIHLIGPKTAHKYEPETKKTLSAIVDTFARLPRPAYPSEIRLTTRTLRYPRMHWLTLLGLEKHWTRADARAVLEQDRVRLSLTNVTSFALDFQTDPARKFSEIVINGQAVAVPATRTTNRLVFSRKNGSWSSGPLSSSISKRPGLQGPIDDAFTDSFIFVVPSRPGFHDETSGWVERELQRATFEWRAQFRGDARIIKDTDVTDDHIRNSNLILWGDPRSNELIRGVLSQLPMEWTAERLQLGGVTVESSTHIPVLIHPNPLNPKKYIVLNSGFTFRGFGSNANQTPKLPDFAVLDVTEPDPFETGLATAGFFNEQWEFDPKLDFGNALEGR